jgi:hypothetical protein
METPVHTYRFESHGEAGDVVPSGFLDDVVAERKANRALAGNWHGFAVGGDNEGVVHGGVGDKVALGWGHGQCGAGVDTEGCWSRG